MKIRARDILPGDIIVSRVDGKTSRLIHLLRRRPIGVRCEATKSVRADS